MLPAEHVKMKIKWSFGTVLRSFFRSMFVTLGCIACVFVIYTGCCKAYESIREVRFDDDRAAVIVCRDYVKFFDFIYYF